MWLTAIGSREACPSSSGDNTLLPHPFASAAASRSVGSCSHSCRHTMLASRRWAPQVRSPSPSAPLCMAQTAVVSAPHAYLHTCQASPSGRQSPAAVRQSGRRGSCPLPPLRHRVCHAFLLCRYFHTSLPLSVVQSSSSALPPCFLYSCRLHAPWCSIPRHCCASSVRSATCL